MIVAVKILHIAAAAVWFGHKLLVPSDVRASIHDLGASDLFIRRMKRAERLGVASGLVTLLSGLALINLVWGFAEGPLRIYLGLAAALAMFVVGAAVARPAWKRVRSGLEAGDVAGAAAGVGPFTRALALENLLWVFALATMVA